MESVFLSYTFEPHPTFRKQNESLVENSRTVIEAMGLRCYDGENLGGGGVTQEVENLISECDALVAVTLPHKTIDDSLVISPWVLKEFEIAKAKQLKTLRIVHEVFQNHQGFGAEEYALFVPKNPIKAILKLTETLGVWKDELGKPCQLIINHEFAVNFDSKNPNHHCKYRLLYRPKETAWKRAFVWKEPGGMFAYIRGIPDKFKIKIHMDIDGVILESDYQDPFGQISLVKK
jgi:hypothetical protein